MTDGKGTVDVLKKSYDVGYIIHIVIAAAVTANTLST